MEFADIIIDISHEKVDRPFTYRVPEGMREQIRIGSCVTVPFGQGNTRRLGYVVGFRDSCSYDPHKIKEILSFATDTLPAQERMVHLAAWMKETYGSTMIQALKTVLPASRKQKRLTHRFIRLRMPLREAQEYYFTCLKKNQTARVRLLQELLKDPEVRIPYSLVTGKLNVSAAVIRSLTEKGVTSVEEEAYYRNPAGEAKGKEKLLSLSDEQSLVVNGVIEDFDAGHFGTYLIHGITGSGKTEVYIRLIEQVIRRGRQAIVLIPEIALTYQTLMRFLRHFGDRVSVMNSTLSPGERFDQFERARKGDIDIIIGPRSALFTPFPSPGLIIIDEEHEPTYKSETMPKYHARETAIALAGMVKEGASVVLGSATPSVESYYRALKGDYHLFALTKRLTGGSLPEVTVSDLRKELLAGNRSIFSRKLQEGMEDRLEKGEQTMLFLNRRGLAGFVSCRACGYVFKCPHCDVSLSEHRGGKLVCHYCGYEEPIRKTCPSCGSRYVSAFRAGTQQVEKQVLKMFPRARVLRMDADTTRRKGSYEKILSTFANREADILVGTQMIVKGHDFPFVTLVGILAADMSLFASDFMAGERTFQLLTQAAGRAGRGETPGEVVIQTYQPDHYAVQAAARQDYKAFYEQEISYRRLLQYPPAAHMLAVQITAADEERGMAWSKRFLSVMEEKADQKTQFIGPSPAQISRISDIYRMVIYIKHGDRSQLTALKDTLEKYLTACTREGTLVGVQVQFDFNPVRGF